MVHSLGRATLGVSILPTSSILPWLVRYQSYLRNRFVVRSSGRTPFEELTMSKFQSPLLNFAEAVLAKESGVQEGKLGSSWDLWKLVGNQHLEAKRAMKKDRE